MKTEHSPAALQEVFDINPIFARKLYHLASKENLLEDVARMIADKPKPFVKWVGGKRQLLRQFKELGLYPPDGFDPINATYYEPFVGGGAVFFDLLPSNAVLSDLNAELVTTYNVIKHDVEKLITFLSNHEVSKEYFLQMRALNPRDLKPEGVASRFIYLNRTGFNGLYRVNKSGQFNVPFGRNGNPTICDAVNLRKVSRALQNVEIAHRDYKHVLDAAKKGDFVYFDPPYYPVSKTASFTSYTAESFLDREQLELRDVFAELSQRGCYVMLSNSDADFINQIYAEIPGVRISKIYASRAVNSKVSGRGKVIEILVTNYS